MSRDRFWLAAAVLAALCLVGAAPAFAQIPPPMLEGFRYRLIGPFRGGRVNTVAGVAGDPRIYYFGAPGGGVWKTTDGGTTWTPIFDDQPVGSIGSIAVADSDPNIIYVGTGDPKIRGNVAHGNGVYRSSDAGSTWTHVGLDDTRHIARVVVHPTDPNVVLVAAVGHFYGDNEQRGMFRSEDGGETWKKTLYVDETTGAADVAIDPGDPNVVFASMWQVRRTPWDLTSGGPGSGLYRSTDGGQSWTRLDGRGLPEGVLGKIGVAVSPADSKRVYALIEARDGGLYRSEDGGLSWSRVNGTRQLDQRAWYFMRVIPDPVSPDVVYVMSIRLLKSVDGGRSFTVIDQFHVDNQELWIDPEDPQRMINGNDGGANISLNGGATWSRSDDHQPIGQFYRAATDNRFPYHIYGGQQDWDTIAIASRGVGGGIGRTDWYSVGGCEMGWAAPDPNDAGIVYAGCTDGGISRFDARTGRNQSVEPWPETNIGHGAGDAKYRFQWTAPFIVSEHAPHTLYMGSNVLLQSTDSGMSWSEASGDLTRDDKSKQEPAGGPITPDNVGTEVFGTIFALDESPLEAGLLWAGSDDGLVHLTRDGGESWANVTPGSLAPWSRIHSVEASPHAASTAYVAVDRHEFDDYQAYVYKTSDFGTSWTLVADGIPEGAFVRAVREDPRRAGLVYAGTELGVYVSLDSGAHWQTLQRNLPVSPVWDLAVHENDLVIATHGRAFWVLDDVSPLRQMTGPPGDSLVVFEPSPAYRVRDDYFARLRTPHGENPPAGAIIYYYLPDVPEGPVTLSILDEHGDEVRSFTSERAMRDPFGASSPVTAHQGLNRFNWDLRYPGPDRIPGHVLFMHPPPAPPVGALALSASYTARLEVDGKLAEKSFSIVSDPRLDTPPDELAAQFELHQQVVSVLSSVNTAVLGIRDVREQLVELDRFAAARGAEPLVQATANLENELTAIENALIEPRMQTQADAFRYPTKLDTKLGLLIGVVANSDRAPTQQSYDVFNGLQERARAELDGLRSLYETDVAALNRLAESEEGPAIVAPSMRE